MAVAWYAVFLFSIVCHEAAHSWAAMRGGDPTAYDGGQVSLNPIPHIRREPIGMVLLPLIFLATWGWPLGFASAPYNPAWAYDHPKRAAWMAAAGPGANLLIALFAGIVLVAMAPDPNLAVTGAQQAAGGTADSAFRLLNMLFYLNVILATLNMIPLPPLDGSSVLMLFMKPDTARKYQQMTASPLLAIAGLILVWQVFPHIVQPVLGFAYGLL